MICNFIVPLTLVTISLALPSFSAGAAESRGEVLDLQTFLSQVKGQHEGIKASQETEAGAEIRQSEGDVLLSPQLTANVQEFRDRKETANPVSQGEKSRQQSASVGVGKLFESGTQAKLSYGVAHTKIDGASPVFLPNNDFYTAGPTLEISQGLWRNWRGSETQATRDLINAQAGVVRYQEAFRTKLTLAEAEMTYWRLVLARETVAAQKNSLERFQKLKSWNAKRVRDALTDKTDLLQSDAAVRAKQLELQLAEDEEKAAGRALNLARGKDAQKVAETLTTIDNRLVDTIVLPAKHEIREDVKAADEAALLADASLRANEAKFTPTLEAFGSIGLNGRDDNFPRANKESFRSSNPTTVMGLRLTAPLDVALVNRAKSAYLRDRAAADLTAKRKHFEGAQNYRELNIQFADAKARFKLAESIETVQKEKLEHEKQRHRVGRTTTSQVLIFEQDYANSQLSRIKTQADIMRIVAQLKTYGG